MLHAKGALRVSVVRVPRGQDLRSLMRLFPSGVCVVGADAHGDRIGATAGSLVSLSLDPPLVGISVGRDLALHQLLRSAGAFGVSILRGDQAGLAAQFARGAPPIVLWQGVATRDGVTGAPLLADALAWIECRVWAEYEAGDHTLFVGEVVAVEEGEPGPGLVYREHGYHAV
jgi:3-hydroxy-9,10-secoandrosta-1,3,5(10)-triene-9,17-dione monooxygenase reductase component